FGDEKDRVLIKSDGQFTYLAADIAYHHHKFSREGVEGTPQYNRIVNIWGADHHGYIPRMRGAIEALGHPVNEFEILLGQLVNLIVDGEKARMGKRRKMLTLADVVEEVGVDATRFWMVNKSADTTLDFDVNLAASATDENPVYYVQYAHARCAGILRNATQDNVNVATGEKAPALLTEEALKAYEQNLTADHLSAMLDNLDSDEARQRVKDLILKLDQFEDLVVDAANLRAPHLLARYALELSADFHGLYNVCRILTPDADVTLGRLMVIIALKKILAQTLYLLGVSAPDRM
ncbi:MAG: hypothetical protein KTR14_01400, partial [Vampirovibrio sp.]|nr:hypothetical protein [Vampirovibrio sp.]